MLPGAFPGLRARRASAVAGERLAPGVERRARPSLARRSGWRSRDPRRAGRPRAGAARAPRASGRARTARTACRRRRSSASGWMPTGVASTGTSQASASSTASPKPSRVGGHEHGVGGVDPQRHALGARRRRAPAARRPSPGERERAIVALLAGARGRRRTAGRAASGPAPARRAPARGGWDRKRSRSTPHGSTCARARARRPGKFRRERGGDGREQVDQRQHGGGGQRVCAGGARRCRGRSAPRTRAGTASERPGGQAEVGVHDVEGRSCPRTRCEPRALGVGRGGGVAPAQLECGRGERAWRRAGTRTARPRGRRARAARRPGRARTCRARDGRRRAACWRPRARARCPDGSALE